MGAVLRRGKAGPQALAAGRGSFLSPAKGEEERRGFHWRTWQIPLPYRGCSHTPKCSCHPRRQPCCAPSASSDSLGLHRKPQVSHAKPVTAENGP